MRIIAGEFKGRTIESPSERTTRPTTDRVRESIFSAVYSRLPELDETDVLDAFAGSGALGIEALSRGARSCVFVERDRSALEVLEGNLRKLGLSSPCARVVNADAFDSRRFLRSQGARPFGLVLLDPPYAVEPQEVRALLDDLVQESLLASGCVVVYEHSLGSRVAVAEQFATGIPFEVTGDKKYGKIGVTFLRHRDRDSEE